MSIRVSKKTRQDQVGDQVYTFDQFGFLDPPTQWNEQFVRDMAEQVGIYGPLTDRHWSFIHYLRRKFSEEQTVPLLVLACADNSIRLRELKALFPAGYHRGACKIAGINYDFLYETNFLFTFENYKNLEKEFAVSQLGFLESFDDWSRRFAHKVALAWELPGGVTDRHWDVIGFLREYYLDENDIPTVYKTCKAHGLSLSELHELFPGGYRRGACQMAGLPFAS